MGDVIDVHCSWGPTIAAPSWNDIETVEAAMKERGVTGAVLTSSLARRYDPLAGNDVVRDVIAEDRPGFELRGWLVVHPDQLDELSGQMRRYLYDTRFVGAALYPNPITGDPVTLEDSRELLTVFRRFSKALLIEANTAEAMRYVVEIATFMGSSKIIASGMGGVEWRAAIDFAVKPANLFLDISGVLDPAKIAYANRAMSGVRKLLFGSGAPQTDPAAILALLDESAITNEERERICCLNARRIFGFAGESGDDSPIGLTPMG